MIRGALLEGTFRKIPKVDITTLLMKTGAVIRIEKDEKTALYIHVGGSFIVPYDVVFSN